MDNFFLIYTIRDERILVSERAHVFRKGRRFSGFAARFLDMEKKYL
ncbi:hypothetical protein B4135_0835 [Caldibacillus debilis]|uniref:Uncharacterized protein n=1 Tax=Caldibacillus debilis TaxID=301148 RepID=A0A150M6C3_9BACI|nr:hypothetical protein B4135_0835 [Caldibacillus debilis]